MKNADMPAMPLGDACLSSAHINPSVMGLTKREYFAGLAMQGLLADSEVNAGSELVAIVAIEYADALLAALENQNDPT